MFNFRGVKLYSLIIFFLILLFYFVTNQGITFLYFNPYTETAGFHKIAGTIKDLNNAFNFTKSVSAESGYTFSYLFKNAYGSGFLKNNPIPNDLDFSVGVYLGEYNYDGDNASEIANSIVKKMDSFQYVFNYYINTLNDKSLYVDKSIFEVLGQIQKVHKQNTDVITQSLPVVLEGKGYVRYTVKTMDGIFERKEVELPYILKSNEILIENYPPITLYSDNVAYNDNMPHYMREISIVPEFFAKINTKEKNVIVEIVPEAFIGERLQLSRRFFASTVFVDNSCYKYLKNLPYLKNDEDYFYYRMLSFRRHLLEISNIQLAKNRPVKMLKRVMQTADIISPLIDRKTYDEISKVINENLSDRDIQLLNEYSNICINIYHIQDSPKLFLNLLEDGKIQVMYDALSSVTAELENRGNIDKQVINKLKGFQTTDLHQILTLANQLQVIEFKKNVFDVKFGDLTDIINKTVYSKMHKPEKLISYIELFNKIYLDAGYHKVILCWIDKETMGIVKDNFTGNIKDLKQFAKENNLADVNYKFINPEDISHYIVKYNIWARYNPSEQQNKNYENLRQALLKDKQNFKLKRSFVLAK